MNRIQILLIFSLISFSTYSQGFLKKLKEAVEDQVEDADAGSLINKDDRMSGFRNQQLVKDTSNYNYIFSQGNRASFFANREGKESLLLTIAKNYEDEEEGIDAVELELYEQAFDLNRSGEMSIYINPWAANLNFLEALGLMTSQFAYSEALLDSAFEITDLVDIDTLNIPEKYALGKTIANISILIHAEGKYNLSEDFINETIKYFKEHIGENSIALASLNNNHAVIAQSQGRYTEAENYFNEAEEIIKMNDRVGSLSHAIITSNRALLYNEIGQYEEAKAAIQRAMEMASGEIRERGRDNVSFQINQGLIYYSAGEYEQAEQVFREIIELKEKRFAKNQTDVGNVKNYLAATLMESGKPAEVPELLNDALRIFEKKYSTDHPAYIKTKHNLGRYYLASGDYQNASSTLSDVNKTYESFFGDQHPDYLSSLEDLAVVAWKLEDYAVAKSRFEKVINSNLALVEKYFGAMSEYEKGQYWAKVRPSILKFYAYAVDQGDADPTLLTDMYNLHLKTKGILLSASSKVREQILSSDNEELKNTYSEWVETKESLLVYYSYSKSQLQEQQIDLAAEEAKANQLEKELNRLSSTFAQSNKLPSTTLADVKTKLGAKDAAIEIIGYPAFENTFTDEKKYAFLIADLSSANPKLVVIDDGQELDTKYAKAYLNMVKVKAKDRITYDKFWKPVDEVLMGKEDVHLSLDGVYFQVNIGGLQRQDGSFVSDALDLHLYTSTRDLVKPKKDGFASKKASFIGYPDFGAKGLLAPLPGTKAEIDAASQITKSRGFSTDVFMQNQATEEQFKKISSPSLLHVATHGFFLPESQTSGEKVFGVEVSEAKDNPLLRSGLMLANAEQTMTEATQGTEVNTTNNGVLTAYEVITLDLKNTDLVVLSACETGLGEIKSGEGVYGLQRAFQVAGAESVIMSLWKVSDEATMQLMTNFYKEWMGGKPKEEAFFTAQKKLRESFPEPYYWGAFVMLN
ncbi:CHAT domain-containing protein [Ekhidna lutea]|uniref:CHAT domain-containing protein n=1 Tax=Ekhidna lutea TaxID=447679 RepID=A0A239IXK2_EKHLU|nr:CHAT domain-containing tetratricopeptide repeat protein [Ekhidna lutea]SNS97948.1 CHAT domain-containing protein [Ekhidna lutea]